METGIGDLLAIAIPAILFAFFIVVVMVHKELGPFVGASTGGKWILTLAFGMGVLAFSFKTVVALSVAKAPERVVAPALAAYRQSPVQHLPDAERLFAVGALPARYVWEALPTVAPAPADNPTTPEKVALGKRLYYDTRLSGDGTLSCASCHDLYDKAGGDGRRTAQGIAGQVGGRNVPTVWNAAFQSVLFWDGRARSLEEQAAGPIMNPIEMGMPTAVEAAQRIAADPAYREEFARVFGAGQAINLELIAKAIAAFERTLVTPDAPYDRFVRGDTGVLTAPQQRGMALFESLGCVTCHQGPAFSDASLLGGKMAFRVFPANATPFETRYGLMRDGGATGRENVRGVWRVPSLRNVALTGPYFHNGSVDTLEEAVRIMASAQLGAQLATSRHAVDAQQATWSPATRSFVRETRRSVSERDIADIVSFLRALSSDTLVVRVGAEKPSQLSRR
jgi:cytochrome c peroxidase